MIVANHMPEPSPIRVLIEDHQPDSVAGADGERVYFIEAPLAAHGGDVRQAAPQLGTSRSALDRRLHQYGVRA